MLRLATLGLLHQKSLNGYRLKQQLETFMDGCLCANYGAIYPLLKRLEEQGEIILSEDTIDLGQVRKAYSLTALGRAQWHQEMLAHPQEGWVNSRSRFLIKFFFFSYLQPEERVQLLEHRLMTCRLRLTHKQAIAPSTDFFQATIQQRAIAVIQSEIDWLSEQLAQPMVASQMLMPLQTSQ